MGMLFGLIFISILSFMMYSVMSDSVKSKLMSVISDIVVKVKSLIGK